MAHGLSYWAVAVRCHAGAECIRRVRRRCWPETTSHQHSLTLCLVLTHDERSMNLRFIEAFVWVARLRSFTAAAEKLNTTQAAISARIATLETDFGVKLFDRDKRSVTLTNSGEELLKHAEELLGMSARMREAVADRAAYGGFIAIGVNEPVVLTWLPQLLGALRRQFPTVRVEIHSYITTYLHEELLRGNLDLALTAQAIANPAIENSSICSFQMGWIIAPTARGDP